MTAKENPLVLASDAIKRAQPNTPEPDSKEPVTQWPHWLLTTSFLPNRHKTLWIGVPTAFEDPSSSFPHPDPHDNSRPHNGHEYVLGIMHKHATETTPEENSLPLLEKLRQSGKPTFVLCPHSVSEEIGPVLTLNSWNKTASYPKGSRTMWHSNALTQGIFKPVQSKCIWDLWINIEATPLISGRNLYNSWTTLMQNANLDPFHKTGDTLPRLPDFLREDTLGWLTFESGDQLAGLPEDHNSLLVATDGSLRVDQDEQPAMGAGIYPHRGHHTLPPTSQAVVGEYVAFYPEAAAIQITLTAVPQTVPLTIASDCAVLLYLIEGMTRATFWRPLDYHRYAGILQPIIEALENRQATTTFIKVKAHRGQLLNEQADYMAVQGTLQPKDLAFACDRNPGFRKWDVKVTDTTAQDKETALVYLTDIFHIVQSAHLEAWKGDPKHQTTVTYQRLTASGIGHAWRAKVLAHVTTPSLPDSTIRQVVQHMAGQFPSNSWLWRIGKRDNPQCELCPSQLHGTVGHIQCDCIALADARTKAHNNIWDSVWNTLLKQSSKQGWQGYKETPIHKTKWKVSPDAERLQPDGILYREEEGATQILILDLARCRGYDTLAFEATADRKTLKYAPLAQQLQTAIPAQVQVLALPVGHAGNISEAHWTTLAGALRLTPKGKDRLYQTATTSAIQAFSFMITIWREAKKAHLENITALAGGSRGSRDVGSVYTT